MRAVLLLPVLLCAGTAHVFAQSYGVGVGTTNPLNTLHVSKGGGLTVAPDVFTAPDSIALSGVGIRMFWAPSKLAFRAGEVSALKPNWWNKDSVGYASFAFGTDLLVHGDYSTSFGFLNEIEGPQNTVFGTNNIVGRGPVLKQYNFVAGNQNEVVTNHNTVFGISNKVVAGFNGHNLIHGNNNLSQGEYGVLLGQGNILRTVYGGHAFGDDNIIKHSGHTVIGSSNDTTVMTATGQQPLLQVAQFAAGPRATRMMVTSAGNVGINVHEPLARLHVDGPIIVGDNQGSYAPVRGMVRFDSAAGALQVNLGAPSYPWLSLLGAGSGSSGGWLTTGNTGTSPSTNFIGTADAQPLVFRVANERAGYLDPGGGFSYNTSFGMQALRAPTSGYDNVALGWRALYRDTSGSSNTAIGRGALYSNYGGSENVAVGTDALFSANASRNVAVGFNAASATTGSGVVAVGHRAAVANTTGRGIVAIGASTLQASSTKNFLIAIGDSALYNTGAGTDVYEGSSNVAIGHKAMFQNTTGFGNVAVGPSAMHNNTAGVWNVAVGTSALEKNTTGFENFAIGNAAMAYNTTGARNIGVGAQALYLNTTGDYNTAIGNFAMYDNETGYANTAIGDETLTRIKDGTENVAVGHGAMGRRRSGHRNTALGSGAMYRDTLGRGNVALGTDAMHSALGSYTIAIGDSALYNQSGGERNVAVGSKSAVRLTTGNANVALGNNTLSSITVQQSNVAIGDSALYATGTGASGFDGWQNVAVGDRALRSNTLGFRNTATGNDALRSTTTGDDNTGHGAAAFFSNTTGGGNTGLGSFAGYQIASGSFNTVVGASAGTMPTAGSNNTIIGSQADASITTLSNATVLGASTIINANNKVRLGNSLVTVVEGQVGYTFPSDGRFKKDVSAAGVPGLDFIRALKPVSYHFDYPAFSKFLGEKGVDEQQLQSRSEEPEIGFIAQDVERLAREQGVVFNGVHPPESSKDNYSLSYAHFVMPLVKAVQEQQSVIEAQGKAIAELTAELKNLREEIKATKQ